MNLSSLEELLGVKHAICERRAILPRDTWQRLKDALDEDGTTLLMKAARDGATECVELLLKCGEDVNTCRVFHRGVDERRRAIDFAVDEGHRKIVLILLKWDSILPDPDANRLHEKLKCMIENDEDIRAFFAERDHFHARLADGDLSAVEDTLGNNNDGLRGPNFWVNSKGRSSLYTACYEMEYNCWALLKSKKFECLEEEIGRMNSMLGDKHHGVEFNQAVGRYFTEVEDCHVYKMLLKTRVGGNLKDEGRKIQSIYEDANKVPEARLLLQCLQDEPHFEVIFDLGRSDISCMYSGSSSAVKGIMDPQLDRVYVSAALETHSDVVSNLVHELAHKVMSVIFNNGGLPFTRIDSNKKKAYGDIVSTIMATSNLENCHDIIKRVKNYRKKYYAEELIVRVPEIIAKNQLEHGNAEGSNPWKNEHEKTLFDFYSNHVQENIKNWIKNNATKNRMPVCDILTYPTLLSDHMSDPIEVDHIENAKICQHNGVRFFRVSNLKLGLDHLKKSLKTLVCLDWNKFIRSRMYFETGLMRGYFDNLAVVWDKEMGTAFCNNSDCCKGSCPAYIFSKHQKYVTLVIPKEFAVPKGKAPVEYQWKHLSAKTKTWVTDRKVTFQGSEVTIKDMIGGLVGIGNVESTMNSLLDSDQISILIEKGDLAFGGDMESELLERVHILLRNHPQSFITRRMKVRPVDLKEDLLHRRTWDAVFIFNTTEDDLEEARLGEVCLWDGENIPDGMRYFLVKEDLHSEREGDICDKIVDELRRLPGSGGKWQFAHFYRYKEKKFAHIHSQCINEKRCLVLADAPGSGKSVLVNSEARKEKKAHPERWVGVVELTDHEGVISEWNEIYSQSKKNLETFLLRLLKKGHTRTSTDGHFSLEQKVFKLFCHTKKKVRVYFDGFDEICPDYKEKLSTFLETLLHSTEVTFRVTTRTHECADLEKRLSTIAYNLVPFDETEQATFINLEWNALLNSLSKSERKEKIKAIISSAHRHSEGKNKMGVMIAKLEKLLMDDADLSASEVNFNKAARELIKNGKSFIMEEGYLSEIPLHTWMLASLCFQGNQICGGSLRLPLLYAQFIDIKIEFYSCEKAKGNQTVAGDCKEKLFAIAMRQLLKKFSAFFFLQGEKNKPSDDEIHDMLRVGLVVKKDSSISFIHRTFGEYLFSLWLLEEASDAEVTRVFLSKVLLEDQYGKVRKFIDGILLPQNENESHNSGESTVCKKNLPTPSAFPVREELVRSLRFGFYKSIAECHEGILQYLAEISRECLADALFGESDDNSANFTVIFSRLKTYRSRNAFTFCGACIFGEKHKFNTDYSMKNLKFLQNLLKLTEEYGLIEYLRRMISKEGLWWTGVNWNFLWDEEEGRVHFSSIFNFLMKHKNVLGKTLKNKIIEMECEKLFVHASLNSFDLLQGLLESLLEGEYEKLLVPSFKDGPFKMSRNLVAAWTTVIKRSTVEKVKHIWKYFESKLTTREKRIKFLRRKDYEGMNALVAAISNRWNDGVISFIWELMRTEFHKKECMDLIFESFQGAKVLTIVNHSTDNFVKWLTDVIRNEFLSFEESIRLLRCKNKYGAPYLLKYRSTFSPFGLFEMQNFFVAAGRRKLRHNGIKEILEHTEGHLTWLAPSCFSMSTFKESSTLCSIQKEFKRLLPGLKLHLPAADIPLDEDGLIRDMMTIRGDGIRGNSLMAYVVILARQLELESRYFTARELKERIKRDWLEIYDHIPLFRVISTDEGVRKTSSFLIPYFFAVLSSFLSKEQLSEVLLHGTDVHCSAFHSALGTDIWGTCDLMAFLAMYDVARLSLGQNALWRVHSNQKGQVKSLLNTLLQRQEQGYSVH